MQRIIIPLWRSRALIVFTILGLYVGSYLVWSRWATAEAQRYHSPAFYYFSDCDDLEQFDYWNQVAYAIYQPLNFVDSRLGLGMPASSCVGCGFRLAK